jgi:hypothetical protein
MANSNISGEERERERKREGKNPQKRSARRGKEREKGKKNLGAGEEDRESGEREPLGANPCRA